MNPIILATQFVRTVSRSHTLISIPTKQPIHQLHTLAVTNNHINPDCGFNQAHIKATFQHLDDQSSSATIHFPQTANHIRKFQNSSGSLHGATHFALHDLAACHALHSLGYNGATKSATIAYVEPAQAKYIHQAQAIATIKAIRGHSAYINSDLFINDKTLVSTAQLVFSVWKPSHEQK